MEQNSSGRGPAGGFDPQRLREVQNWRRSRSDRLVAGVCSGIGRALDIDPVLIRVVIGVLIVLGPGLPLYLAAWLLMPQDGTDRSVAQDVLGDRVRTDHPWLWPTVIGIGVFIAIGIASSVDSGPFKLGPIVVIGVIWYVFFYKKKGARQSPVPPTTPPAAPVRPQDSQRPQDTTRTSVQPVWTEDDPLGLYVDEAPAPRPAQPAVRANPGLRIVKPLVLSATLLAIAIAWIAQASLPLMLAIGLATLGLGMLVGGFAGKTLGLLPVGILLAVGVAATQVFPTVPRVRDLNYVASPETPITATTPAFQVDAGSIRIDLTKAKFEKGAKISASGKAGEIVVQLPKNVDVTGVGQVKMGHVQAFDRDKGGYQAELTFSDLGADKVAGPDSVELDLDLTTGSIVVERP
ncbi:PspC domain-containing protein [Kribbella sp. NBC_01245]|uniref:PspC domain-containing protein n=1 Tax=Kribbella sp. NBC_01245 TaxID=2903578 RepID=UPI002E2B880B|nr:PspC domain-containing protein [Kribbella sp. NBC_01245]